MGSEWSIISLGDCGIWHSGGTPDTDRAEYWNGNIPWISASSLHDFYIRDSDRRVSELGIRNGTRLMPAQTILFVVRGMSLKTEFRVGITQRPVAFGQDCKAIIVRDGIDPLFLANSLRARAPDILSLVDEASHGTGRLQTEALKQLEIDLPPLDEQRAIAAVLGALDDKIELNRRMNGTLEALARALFRSWFVDFEPVRARMEGPKVVGAGLVPAPAQAQDEEGNHKGLPLPPDIAALFPDEMEVGEDGVERPRGWRVGSIGNIVQVVGGSTPSTKEPRYWDDGEYYWTTPKDLSSLSVPVLLGSERKITTEGLTQISSGLLPVGTILMSSRAPIGYLAIAEVPTAINQGFIAMIPNDGISNLFILLWAEEAQKEIISRANGSTFLEISKSNFRPIELVVPTEAVMEAFDNFVQPIYRRIVTNEKESRTLAALRDALLPKLMSGEVRVPIVENLFGVV